MSLIPVGFTCRLQPRPTSRAANMQLCLSSPPQDCATGSVSAFIMGNGFGVNPFLESSMQAIHPLSQILHGSFPNKDSELCNCGTRDEAASFINLRFTFCMVCVLLPSQFVEHRHSFLTSGGEKCSRCRCLFSASSHSPSFLPAPTSSTPTTSLPRAGFDPEIYLNAHSYHSRANIMTASQPLHIVCL